MNETTMKEKEPYEAPLVLEIKPVSVVRGNNERTPRAMENTITSMKADYRSRLFLTKYGTAADDRPA